MELSTTEGILETISMNTEGIYNRLSNEDIDVYVFLIDRFHSCRKSITTDHLFQFLFRSYYRLDNAGLTNEFKAAYFRIMEGLSDQKEINLETVCNSLKAYKNKKDQVTLQFSFCTKLIATINTDYPIYDSFVAKVFNFSLSQSDNSYEAKLVEYMRFYQYLSVVMSSISRSKEMAELDCLLINKIDNWNQITNTKKADFIIWTTGKIINKK